MKIWTISYLILLYALLMAGCDVNNDVKDGLSYQEYLQIGKQFEDKGENDKAISAYKKASKIKPDNANIHYVLGRLYDTESQRSYRDAFDKSLLNRLTNVNRSKIKDQTKELESYGYKSQYKALALKEYKEAIIYDPHNWAARYFVATDLVNNKRYKESIIEYNNVIKINPNYSPAYSLLGESYLQVGYCRLAIESFTKAYKLDSDADAYYSDVGRVYLKMNDDEKVKEMKIKLKGKQHYYDKLIDYQYEPHGKCVQ